MHIFNRFLFRMKTYFRLYILIICILSGESLWALFALIFQIIIIVTWNSTKFSSRISNLLRRKRRIMIFIILISRIILGKSPLWRGIYFDINVTISWRRLIYLIFSCHWLILNHAFYTNIFTFYWKLGTSIARWMLITFTIMSALFIWFRIYIVILLHTIFHFIIFRTKSLSIRFPFLFSKDHFSLWVYSHL